MRFWGKLQGRKKDLWVAEGTLAKAEEASSDPEMEPRGKGVNKLVYWVTDSLLEDWVQLPDCEPAHIKAAR